MINRKGFGRKRTSPKRGDFPAFPSRIWRRQPNLSIRIAGVLVEIRTGHFLYMNLEIYRYAIPLGSSLLLGSPFDPGDGRNSSKESGDLYRNTRRHIPNNSGLIFFLNYLCTNKVNPKVCTGNTLETGLLQLNFIFKHSKPSGYYMYHPLYYYRTSAFYSHNILVFVCSVWFSQ
jgi:hypothetical protein